MKGFTIFLFALFILLTLTSSLPMNILINNQNKDNNAQNQNQIKNTISNQRLKLDSIVNPTAYSYGDIINVRDVVNMTYLYLNIYHANYDQLWYAPDQHVEVYIGVDPCATHDSNYNCYAGSIPAPGKTLNDYKLTVNSGNPVTKGTDTTGDMVDDNLGTIPLTSSTSAKNSYFNALSYNFTVKTPSQPEFQSLNLQSQTPLYEYFPGNNTYPGWDIRVTSITFSSDSNTAFTPLQSSYTIMAQSNTSVINFNASLLNSLMPNTYVAFWMLNASNNNQTICNSISLCDSAGFKIQQSSIGSNNSDPKLTGSDSINTISVSFTGLYSVNEGAYYLVAEAMYVNPPDQNATNYGPIYSLTLNKNASVLINVFYNLQTPLIQQVNHTYSTGSFNLFPFKTNDHRIRPGDYIEGTIHTNVNYQNTNISGAKIDVQMYDALTQQNYTSDLTSPTGIATLSYLGNANNATFYNGTIRFRITLSKSAPLTTFNVVIYGDYAGMTNVTPFWIKDATARLATNYTFTVDNLFDSGRINFIEALPSNDTQLTTSLTNLTFLYQATATLNGTYAAYAANYGITLPPTIYPLYLLPVNATIYLGPISEVNLSVTSGFVSSPYSGYYYTNSSGYIAFSLTTRYPNIYNLTQYALAVVGNYIPLFTSNATYAFTRDGASILNSYTNTSTNSSGVALFNPNYKIINVTYVGTNITGNSLNPGDTGYFIYQAYYTGNLTGVQNVPFTFNILDGLNTPGIYYYTNATKNMTYYVSGKNGYFFIFFNSTYGIAPENASGIKISFNVYLNITLYNSTFNPDNRFYVGISPAPKGVYSDYVNTWSNDSSNFFYLKPKYLFAEPVWQDPVNDSNVLVGTAGINLVRPDNETITVRLYIRFSNGSIVNNTQIPVNVTMSSTYPNASLNTSYSLYTTGWYLTNYLGYIEFNITVMYYKNSPKTGLIRLNATAEFGNMSLLNSSYSPNVYRWIVGSHNVSNYNLSQSSLEWINTANKLLNVTVDPAYLYGQITGQDAILGQSSGNPFTLQPNSYVTLPFEVTINKTSYSQDDKLASIPLPGINVYLNETVLYSYNMSVVNNGLITDSAGIVDFNVSVSSTTVDGIYVIPAYADFENDSGLSPLIVGKTNTFNHNWLNGSISTNGTINNITLQSIQNYSPGNSSTLIVKAARSMSIAILKVFDKNMKEVILPSYVNHTTFLTNVTVLRGYTLEVSVTYKDQNGNGLTGNVDLTTIVNDPNPLNVNRTNPIFSITNSSGFVTYNITIGSNYNVGKATIIAEDPNLLPGTPFVNNSATFNIDSQLRFSGSPTYTINNGYNEAFAGENITVTGTIQDELGSITNLTYNSNVLNEFIHNLKITGYNNVTNTTIPNSIVYATINVNSVGATFSAIWTVPTYSGRNISLQVDFNKTGILHFVFNNSLLPSIRLNPILNVFQGVQFYFSLTHTDATNTNMTGKTINVTVDYTGSMNITGNLLDNYNRTLSGRQVFFEIITSAKTNYTATTDSNGYFFVKDIIGKLNQNKTYQLIMYYNTTNNTMIQNLNDTVVRIVHDLTAPFIDIIQVTNGNSQNVINGSYQYQNLNFEFNLTDPTMVGNNYVNATGINKNSVQLLLNGTVYWSSVVNNPTWTPNLPLFITWYYSSINSSYYLVNLTLVVTDNAGNTNTSTFIIRIDHIKPTITVNYPTANDQYLYQSQYVLSFDASDPQTGLNSATAGVYINGNFVSMTNPGGLNTYVSRNISFYRNQTNTILIFTITDNAGNTYNTSQILVLADTQDPTIQLTNSNLVQSINGYDAYTSPITFTFVVSDGQSGVDSSTIKLFNSNNVEIGNNTNLVIQGSINSYTVSGTITRNELNFSNSSQTFLLTVFDLNGNNKSYLLNFSIDNQAPIITNKGVYQPDLKTAVFSNVTTNTQYIQFQYEDLGTPTTGIDYTSVAIQLSINNNTFNLLIQNGSFVWGVNDSSIANDFEIYSFNNTNLVIKWTIHDIAKYGFPQTRSVQNLNIVWKITTLKDKFGNNIQSNPSYEVLYEMDVPARPPPPDVVSQLVDIGFIFGIFIFVGIGAAYVYEKIRYIG